MALSNTPVLNLAPVDYTLDFAQDPYSAGFRGLTQGLAAQASFDAREQAKLAQQQAQEDRQRTLLLAEAEAQQKLILREKLAALGANKNATGADYAAMIATAPPAMSEPLKRAWDILSTEQQQNQLIHVSRVFSALQANNPSVAKELLAQEIETKKAQGLNQEVRSAEDMLKLVETDPANARVRAGLVLAASPGADKLGAGWAAIGGELRAAAKAPLEMEKIASETSKARAETKKAAAEAAAAPEKIKAEIANIKSQIADRAGRLGLGYAELEEKIAARLAEQTLKKTTLTETAQKIVTDSTLAAVSADASADYAKDLAQRMRKVGGGAGYLSRGSEFFKKVFGAEGKVSLIRMEFERLRNKKVVETLPSGPATDRDIQIFSRGFPPSTADAAHIADFLDVMARLSTAEAAMATAKADWTSQNGFIGRNKKPLQIDGYEVPEGTSFVDFSRKYVKDKVGAFEQKAANPAEGTAEQRLKAYKERYGG